MLNSGLSRTQLQQVATKPTADSAVAAVLRAVQCAQANVAWETGCIPFADPEIATNTINS